LYDKFGPGPMKITRTLQSACALQEKYYCINCVLPRTSVKIAYHYHISETTSHIPLKVALTQIRNNLRNQLNYLPLVIGFNGFIRR